MAFLFNAHSFLTQSELNSWFYGAGLFVIFFVLIFFGRMPDLIIQIISRKYPSKYKELMKKVYFGKMKKSDAIASLNLKDPEIDGLMTKYNNFIRPASGVINGAIYVVIVLGVLLMVFQLIIKIALI